MKAADRKTSVAFSFIGSGNLVSDSADSMQVGLHCATSKSGGRFAQDLYDCNPASESELFCDDDLLDFAGAFAALSSL